MASLLDTYSLVLTPTPLPVHTLPSLLGSAGAANPEDAGPWRGLGVYVNLGYACPLNEKHRLERAIAAMGGRVSKFFNKDVRTHGHSLGGWSLTRAGGHARCRRRACRRALLAHRQRTQVVRPVPPPLCACAHAAGTWLSCRSPRCAPCSTRASRSTRSRSLYAVS